METAKVISLLIAKDEQGLSYLYDNYADSLNGIIYRIVGSKKLSEEILQQTFLKVWEKIDSYDSNKSTLFTWISRIARNSAIDARRLKSYENIQKTDSIDSEYDLAVNCVNVPAKMDVEILLKDLDAKHKAVLDCVFLQGYSHREAAEKLELPLGTVKTRVRNALNQIRENLKGEDSLLLNTILVMAILSLMLCQ